MPGGKNNIKPVDGKQFSKDYQPNEKWLEEDALMLANDLLDWLKSDDENIFFNDFFYLACDESKYKGKIYIDLIDYLPKKFSSFSILLEKARKIQETKLVKYSTFDKLNATMTKFVLMNNHKWTDRAEVKSENENTTTISINPIKWVD